MTREQWERLKTVFQAALDQPPAMRGAWIARECSGDDALLQEAKLLLAAHETAGDFLERPATFDSGHEPEPPEPEAPLAPGTRVGPYQIVEELGRGGMGIVYVAEDLRLARRVALKALPAVRAADRVLRERLRREARAAATISHPAVATIFALDEIDDQLFIASEYVAGNTLRQEIDAGPIDPAVARDIALDMARALCAAHEAGVIHRDLKPENVIITADGHVKVVDFGIADIQGAGTTRLTRDGALLGTPAYMAPEQLLGETVDPRADIYAFGVVLEEMLTGQHPLSVQAGSLSTGKRHSSGARERAGGATDASSLRGSSAGPRPGPESPQFSKGLAAVASRCVQVDPAARYPNAHALLADLERTTTGAAPGASPGLPTASPSAARWWWEFHQAMGALVYWLTVIAAWRARELLGGATGRWFFLVTLGAVIVGANLRLHLWFTSRFYPAELRWVRRRVARWVYAADWVFAVALVSAGLLIGEERSPLAIVLLGLGVGVAVAFLLIEPATTRAAFRNSITGGADRSGMHRDA